MRGVLQCNVLSLFLFNIYINDMIKEIGINAFEIIAYADDIDDIAIICKNKENFKSNENSRELV